MVHHAELLAVALRRRVMQHSIDIQKDESTNGRLAGRAARLDTIL